jgi:hypothetical protein
MTSRIAKCCLAAVALSCLPAAAGAVIIVVDPRDHAIGTDLSHAYDGLTMQRLRQNANTPAGYDPVATPVTVSESCSYGPSPCLSGYSEINEWGGCVSGTAAGFLPRSCSIDHWSVLDLTFDVPTNLFQISASFGADTPGMNLYDSLGNLITRCWGVLGTNSACQHTYQREHQSPNGYVDNLLTLTFESTEANISRVVFGGVMGGVTANQILYRYNVPEPGTFTLLGLGLVGMGLSRRKRAGAR